MADGELTAACDLPCPVVRVNDVGQWMPLRPGSMSVASTSRAPRRRVFVPATPDAIAYDPAGPRRASAGERVALRAVDAPPLRAQGHPVHHPTPVVYACPFCRVDNMTTAEAVTDAHLSGEPIHCGRCGGPVGFKVTIKVHAHTPILDLVGREAGLEVAVGASVLRALVYVVED